MRRLYVVINNQDDRSNETVIYEFLKSVFAKDGWEIVMARHKPASVSVVGAEVHTVQ